MKLLKLIQQKKSKQMKQKSKSLNLKSKKTLEEELHHLYQETQQPAVLEKEINTSTEPSVGQFPLMDRNITNRSWLRKQRITEVINILTEEGPDKLKEVMKFTEEIQEKFGCAPKTSWLYIRDAMTAMHLSSIEALKDVLTVHIIRYEEIYQLCLQSGKFREAMQALKQVEDLYGIHRPNIQAQYIQYIDTSKKIENNYENWSVEDIKSVLQIEEKYRTGNASVVTGELGNTENIITRHEINNDRISN